MLTFANAFVFVLALVSITFVSAGQVQVHDVTFTPDIVLRVSQMDAALACVYRTSVVVNGTTPGPMITLRENVTSWIRVYNDMSSDNVTIHWHGLAESVAPFSDGTPRASQWPIPSQHFFDYEIRPEVGSAGSYFYHSHVGFQAVSANGPLIVEEANGAPPPYAYDGEFVFLMTDVYNLSDSTIIAGLTADPFVFSGETEAILVNGKATQAKSANFTSVGKPEPPPRSGSPTCGPEIFYVEPDKTYRFRFIGAQALPYNVVGFENHPNLTIIEADGSYTQPHQVNHLQVGSGQRFDILLRTKTAAQLKHLDKTQFYIQLETRDRPANSTFYAILSYTSNPITDMPAEAPLNLTQTIGGWLEYALEPLRDNNFPTAAEVSRRIYISSTMMPFGANMSGKTGEDWDASGTRWLATNYTNSGTPYLVSIYLHGEAAIPSISRAAQYGGWDPAFNVYPAAVGEVLEIILENEPTMKIGGGYDIHPWHAHGGHYYDIGSGYGRYDPVENEKRLAGYKPVMRDTTMLYRGGVDSSAGKTYSVQAWRGWRLRVEDAGVWMVHCHTLQHMIMGLQTLWVMGNASQITGKGLYESTGYFTFGGDVYGNETFVPSVMHYFDD